MNAPATPSLVQAMSREAYDRASRVNWSTLKLMGKSPAAYRAGLLERGRDSDALRRGTATHTAVYEPERFGAEVAIWTGAARRGKEWAAFEAANAGRTIITEDMAEQVRAIAAAVRGSPMAAPYVSNGTAERSILWVCEEAPALGLDGFSVECKSRIDFVADCGALVDLKTTRDASPEGFGRQVAQMEYHVQAAFYSDAYTAATGRTLPFVLVAVESAAPYVVQVYRVPEDILALGRERYLDLMRQLVHCRATNSWPGYSETVLDLTLPRWAVPFEEDSVEDLGLDFAAQP